MNFKIVSGKDISVYFFIITTLVVNGFTISNASASSSDNCKPSIEAIKAGNHSLAFQAWKESSSGMLFKEQVNIAMRCLLNNKIVATKHGFADWLELRAIEKIPDAYAYLGLVRISGFYTSKVDKDVQSGLYWLKRASNEGHSEATFVLGGMLAFGPKDIRDIEKAEPLIQKSVELGVIGANEAMEQLLRCQENPESKEPRDISNC